MRRVVELPDVLVERRQFFNHPGRRVARDRRPPPVVDAAVAEHLEVLRLTPVRRSGVVEGVDHADALDRPLLDAVNGGRLGQPRCFEDRRCDVDHVVELLPYVALGLDPLRPVHDRPVPGSAPVRGDLLRPLVGRVHRMRPADRVVVVRLGAAELIDMGGHELRSLERRRAIEDEGLVEGPVHRPFGAGSVVADDVVDQRVLEDPEVVEGVHEPPDVVVCVLEEAGVDLHLAGEHGLQLVGHVVPGGNLLMPSSQLGLVGDDAERLLPFDDLLAEGVPALIELTLCTCPPTQQERDAGHG